MVVPITRLCSGGVEAQLGARLSSGSGIQGDVVVQLLLLSGELCGGVLSLRCLGLKLNDCGLELENFVLYFAVLDGGLLIPSGPFKSNVECLNFSVVRDVVDGSEESDISWIDIGQIIQIESSVVGQDSDRLFLCVTGSSSRNRDSKVMLIL